MATTTIIAKGTWELRSSQEFTITSDSGKTVTCTPVAQYNYPEGTQLSHDVDLVVKNGKFIGFKARNPVDPGSNEPDGNEPTAESAAQAQTGPSVKAALSSLRAPKPIPAAFIAKLKAPRRPPKFPH